MRNAVLDAIKFVSPDRAMFRGKSYFYFGGCDYLGFSHDSWLGDITAEAIRREGLGASASRITTGERPIYRALERSLALFLGTEDALILPSGSLSNLALVQSLSENIDVWCIDAMAHPSFSAVLNCSTSTTKIQHYTHLSSSNLERCLSSLSTKKVGIFTDALFPLTGQLAPIAEIISAAATLPAPATIVIDEAHSLGVLGDTGRGVLEHFGIRPATAPVEVILTGTFSKAIGCFGGFIAGPSARLNSIRERSPAYRTSSPLPPFIAAAALSVISRLDADPTLVRALRDNIVQLSNLLRPVKFSNHHPSIPIFAYPNSKDLDITAVATALDNAGILVPPLVGYGPDSDNRVLRCVVTRAHSPCAINSLASALLHAMHPVHVAPTLSTVGQ